MFPLNSILENSIVGFEFEFVPKGSPNSVKNGLQKSLNKNILVFDKSHSEFKPTSSTFKLEKDYSVGGKAIELVTAPLPYSESIKILNTTLKWISENAITTERSGIHLNISFPKSTGLKIENLNKSKFVIGFNESKVYKDWPNRINSPYSKSIKFVLPNNKFGLLKNANEESQYDFINTKNYQFVGEKYYGVNFGKLSNGYLEFRYLGGKGYDSRGSSIIESLNEFIQFTHDVLKNPVINKSESIEFDSLIMNHTPAIKSFRGLKEFKEQYPKIKDEMKIINLKYKKNAMICLVFQGVNIVLSTTFIGIHWPGPVAVAPLLGYIILMCTKLYNTFFISRASLKEERAYSAYLTISKTYNTIDEDHRAPQIQL